ncbi:hypothetical protein [Secundilactobacillus paracollinoides]|uniref:hypothetical protein n=1 Tax=Secundilactobacillus paracollinoides TaxID=240427 RepID=UPI000A61676C|nr:hypothetical protein [Secundilactobacillus paracollinoides]
MAKAKTQFICQNCGYQAPRFLGRCPNCGKWNTLVEEVVESAAAPVSHATVSGTLAKPEKLAAVSTEKEPRIKTQMAELNRALVVVSCLGHLY